MATNTKSSNTTTGFNESAVSKINTAIDAFQSAVDKKCNMSAKKSLIAKAIKGSSTEKELTRAYNELDVSMKEFVKKFDHYNEIVNTLKNEYKSADTSTSTYFAEFAKDVHTGHTIDNNNTGTPTA